MCSLFERFEPPPAGGWVTVLEKDCQFVAEEVRSAEDSHSLQAQKLGVLYEDILVREEDGRRVGPSGEGSNFLPLEEDNPWKRVWDTWWERGTMAALYSLHSQSSGEGDATPDATPFFPSRVSNAVLQCSEKLQRLQAFISSQPPMSVSETIAKYSSHSQWDSSIVRAVALHPRLDFLALARRDDEVDIRSLNNAEQRVVLRDRQQVAVTCMEWAPHCDSLLAVGTGTGLLLWHVDPTTPTTKFVSTWVRYESSPSHTPITSLSWSPWGNFVVCSSPRDNSLLLWDIPLGVGTCIRRGSRGGVASVAWSPDGRRVFAGSVSALFHVWETKKWTCERWQNFKGRCKAGCWSGGGEMLLFALEGDTSLYYISFHGNVGLSTAIKCADLSPCALTDASQDIVNVGGEIHSMAWDTSSQRLAVTFTADSPSAHMVAIFRTRRSELLEVLPGGFVLGREGELPVLITFKPKFAAGALLVVVWSSGRISFIPLHFQNQSSPSDMLPELVQSHTPSSCLPSMVESLKRPSLNRTYETPRANSSPLPPLYSVHAGH